MNNDKERVKIDCCIRGCSGERLTTFSPDPLIVRIPSTPFGLRQQWVHIIRASRNEPSWCPSSDSVVCSFHFRPSELMVTPDSLEAELDLESGKNVVPTLRLGDYENVQSGDEDDSLDGELRILNDTGVKIAPVVKSEPKDADNEGDEDDPFIGPAMVAKKKGKRQNKPTWSLKELQVSDDDESTNRREEEANSSEYEPSSGSDSDGEKTRESKRRRLSAKTPGNNNSNIRPVPGLNGVEMTSGNSFRLKSLQLQQPVQKSNQFITTPTRPNGLTCPPKFTLSAATKSSLQMQSLGQQAKPKLYPMNSDVQLMSRWLVELQAVFKTVQNGGECFKMCNFLLTRLFDHIGLYPNSPEKTMISSHLNTIMDLVRQKSKERSTTASNVHFSLTSKKICDLLHSWMSKKILTTGSVQYGNKLGTSPVPAKVTPPRFTNEFFKNQTNLISGAIARAINPGLKTPTSISPKSVVPVQKSSISPEIVCLDDDEDSDPPFSFKIQSVTTLANTPEAVTSLNFTNPTPTLAKPKPNNSAVHAITPATPTSVRAISLQALVKLAQTTSIPKPVPNDFADSVTWMGQPPSEWVYVGYFTEVEHAESNNISRQNVNAVPPVLSIGKHPPNVPLGCEIFSRAGVANPFFSTSTTSVYSPRQILTSPSVTQRPSLQMGASERLSQLASNVRSVLAAPPLSVKTAYAPSSSSPVAINTASETTTSLEAVPNLSEYDEIIILSDSEEEVSLNPQNTDDNWNVTVTNATSLSDNNISCLEDEILGI